MVVLVQYTTCHKNSHTDFLMEINQRLNGCQNYVTGTLNRIFAIKRDPKYSTTPQFKHHCTTLSP